MADSKAPMEVTPMEMVPMEATPMEMDQLRCRLLPIILMPGILEALNVLNNIRERNAQWYFFSAVANAGVGNNINAMEHAKRAVAMEPNNMQYRSFLNHLESGGQWSQGHGNGIRKRNGNAGRLVQQTLSGIYALSVLLFPSVLMSGRMQVGAVKWGNDERLVFEKENPYNHRFCDSRICYICNCRDAGSFYELKNNQ